MPPRAEMRPGPSLRRPPRRRPWCFLPRRVLAGLFVGLFQRSSAVGHLEKPPNSSGQSCARSNVCYGQTGRATPRPIPGGGPTRPRLPTHSGTVVTVTTSVRQEPAPSIYALMVVNCQAYAPAEGPAMWPSLWTPTRRITRLFRRLSWSPPAAHFIARSFPLCWPV